MGVRTQNFTQLGGSGDFSRTFIWNRVSGLMWFRDGSDKRTVSIFCTSRKNSKDTLAMIRQACGEESASRTRKVQIHRGRKGEQIFRACSSFSLTSRGLFQTILPGRPNSQFRFLLWHFTATSCKCDKAFAPIFSDKRTGCCMTTMHLWEPSMGSSHRLPKSVSKQQIDKQNYRE
jgi:hypothetical protein